MAETTILEGYSDNEKGAYLGAIASLATADRQATEEEMTYLEQLCTAASLSAEQTEVVRQAATEMPSEDLQRCLDVLKGSQLKYSLVTDLMAFAKADSDYSEEEQQNIHKISTYLGLDQQQFALLDQFSKQAVPTEGANPEQNQQAFFGSGLKEKMQSAGINTGGLLKSVISIAAPMILGSMLSRGLGRRTGGGMGGGLGSMLGGGGLGSLIGMLSGGRGMSGMGGMLGKMFGNR